MEEAWRPILGHPNYEVSDAGRVRSFHGGGRGPRILATPVSKRGYPRVTLYTDRRPSYEKVHVLVACAFLGPCPTGFEVRHLNGNPCNNAAGNLAYGNRSRNLLDAVAHGTHAMTARTHCPADHPYDDENTRIDGRGRRNCRACERTRGLAKYHARQAAGLPRYVKSRLA